MNIQLWWTVRNHLPRTISQIRAKAADLVKSVAMTAELYNNYTNEQDSLSLDAHNSQQK